MDQPVVVMERLPENVVKYYLKKSNSNGFDYNSNWLNEKYKKYKKTHHRKKKQKKFNVDTIVNLETDNDWEILNRNTTNSNDSSDKANIVHIMRQSKVCDNKESADVNYPVNTFNEKNINTLIENANLTNENNTCNIIENAITQKDTEENSGPNIKISLSHPISENIENCFCNDEWQVISEASCSDISRSSSPYEEGIKPTNNVRYSTDLSNISKHSSNHQNLQCTTKDEDYQNIVLSECCDVYAFDEDDKLTEPYKSDCDDNISSPLNLKISDTSEQYSENSSNKSQKEFISDNLAKGDKLQLDRIPDASTLKNISQIFDNSQKGLSQEYLTNKDFKLAAQKQELNNNSALDTVKFTCQISNVKYSEFLDNLPNEQQMAKRERLFPNSLTITPIFQENETSGNKTSPLKLINKCDLLNQKQILNENENNQIQEFDYNKQLSSNATNTDSQYDVVGLIMKTMDKTKSSLMTRKSSVDCSDNEVVDNIMKTMETTKSFLITRKPSMESTDSEVSKSSDNEISSIKNDTSIICKFKQKKARMSMSSVKVSCHRDSSHEDSSFYNENPSKNLDLSNINDSKHQNELIDTDVKRTEVDISYNKTNFSIKAINKRKLKIPVSSENKKIKTHGIKKLKFCWRCGKKYAIHSFNDKLCKQCTSLNYTKLSNNNLKCYSDSEYISDKEAIAGDQSDQSTVSEPSFIYHKNSKHLDKEEDRIPQISNEDSKLPFSKSFDKTSTFHNNPVDLSTNKTNSSYDKTNSVPPLKLIVSINQKNIKKSIHSGKNKLDLKLKKQRKKASNINTGHKTYQIDTTIKHPNHMENENIICKILKKQKNKDLLKKRKKSNNIEPDTTESDALEKEESKVKKLKISKTISEIVDTENTTQTETSEELIKESKDKNKESSEKEKKGTCEVINVNRGLFLLSFPEADDDLDPNIFNFPPEKSEIQNSETDKKILSSNITLDKTNESNDDPLNSNHSKKETVLESNSSSALKTPVSINTEESTNVHSVFLNKQDRENLQTTIRLSDDLQEKSESFSDDALQLHTDPLDVMEKRINTKNMKIESAITNDKDLLVNKSIPKIENVFSLRDMPIEQLQEEKHSQSIPSVNNCNVYNELDAYATASILELEQSQEHSVILLTTILAKEFKELHKICLMEKSTNFSLELYNVKMRKIDTIRSLQLACALLTKGQKCKTELSPSMLNMSSEEMSQLLSLCNDIYHNKLSEALSSKNEEIGQKKSITTTSSDKTDQSDLINKKNGINTEVSQQTINIQNTINSLLTPPILNPLPVIPFTTNYNHPSNFRNMPNIPVNANKLDDDVICLGTSNVRNSVIHNQQKEQITLNKVTQNKSQFSTSVSNKDERPGNLTTKQAITLSELPKSNNPQVENNGSAKSQVINKTVLKNNQVTVNIVNNTPVYQKVSFGFNENGNYIPSSNQSSNTTQKGTEERKSSPQSQTDKPVTSNWGQTGTTDVRNISRIQNQWSSQALGKQGLSITQSNSNDRTAGSPAWRNSVSSHNSSSVPNQQRSIQPNIRPSSTLVPVNINQFGTLITRPLIQGNIPVHAGRNIAQVPMFNIHTQGVIRTWHQPPNTPAQVSSHQSQQSPIVCITCRKPISMTCPTGMFCSELCKKAYCAMFPNYR